MTGERKPPFDLDDDDVQAIVDVGEEIGLETDPEEITEFLFRTFDQRKEWGAWRFRLANLTLECRDRAGRHFYYVDLERCRTSAELLDWIFQINQKTWATPEIVKDLLDAIDDLLCPQATLCSGGMAGSAGKRIDPVELLAGREGYREDEDQ